MKNSSDSDSKDEDNKNDDNKSKENLNFLRDKIKYINLENNKDINFYLIHY